MRLIRLLSVGRSLVGVQSEPNRYSVVGPNFFPKLRPVTRGVRADTSARWSVTSHDPNLTGQGLERSIKESSARAASSPEALAQTDGFPVPLGARHETTDQVRSAGPASATKFLYRLLLPFSLRWSPERNQSKGRGGARLDTVSVVRNDLTDVDLELISAHDSTKQRCFVKKSGPPAGGQNWSVLAARLFEVGRSRT